MAVNTTSLVVKDGDNASQSMATATDPAGLMQQVVSLEQPGIASYRASANFTPQATGAVTMISIVGSATKTVRVTKIGIGGVSTAVSQSILKLQRVSALGAGGTEVSPTVAKLDSGTVASATAVVSHWTTTLKAAGTLVGGPINTLNIQTGVVTTPATLALGGLQWMFPEGGVMAGQAIVLRGTSDILTVQNVTPANLGAGTVYAYFVEWVEDDS